MNYSHHYHLAPCGSCQPQTIARCRAIHCANDCAAKGSKNLRVATTNHRTRRLTARTLAQTITLHQHCVARTTTWRRLTAPREEDPLRLHEPQRHTSHRAVWTTTLLDVDQVAVTCVVGYRYGWSQRRVG